MESANFVGRLKEFLEKKQENPPKYDSQIIGGTDHSPVWQSTVSFVYQNVEYVFESTDDQIFTKKVYARQNAAKLALQVLRMINIQDTVITNNTTTSTLSLHFWYW